MRTYDLTPLFRSTIGFDRWSNLFDAAFRGETNGVSYPPYDIEKLGEDAYRITMAVAGFGEDDLDVTVQDNLLVVSGKSAEDRENGKRYLYRGIAARAFERRFSLADYVQVTSASLANGVLTIDLVREVPESLKPRRIAIGAGVPAIEDAKAA